jgi:hypothetical protein
MSNTNQNTDAKGLTDEKLFSVNKITDVIDGTIEANSFRVPYDGSNNFYDDAEIAILEKFKKNFLSTLITLPSDSESLQSELSALSHQNTLLKEGMKEKDEQLKIFGVEYEASLNEVIRLDTELKEACKLLRGLFKFEDASDIFKSQATIESFLARVTPPNPQEPK